MIDCFPCDGAAKSHLNKKIWLQYGDAIEFQPAVMLTYSEDMKPRGNTEIGPEGFWRGLHNTIAKLGLSYPSMSGLKASA